MIVVQKQYHVLCTQVTETIVTGTCQCFRLSPQSVCPDKISNHVSAFIPAEVCARSLAPVMEIV